MRLNKFQLLSLSLAGFVGACGSNSGSGTFPDFGALMLEAAPNLEISSNVQSQTVNESPFRSVISPFAIAIPASSSFSTTGADWTSAIDASQNILGTILDGSTSAPITSMFAQIRGAQSLMDVINTTHSDADGNPTQDCTAIASGTSVTLPFLSTVTNAQFNAWDDAGKYTCYTSQIDAEGATSYLIFGRSAIAAPSEGCTDAFEYYAAAGRSGDDIATRTQDSNNYGTAMDTMSIGRYYYNGCSGEMKANIAWHTLYAGGAGAVFPDKYRFSGRGEITGNETAKTFTLRISFIDDAATADAGNTASGGITVVAGHGKSRKASDSDSTAHFAIGFDKDSNCTTAGASCSDTSAKSFCVSNASTTDTYTQVTSAPATACADYTTTFDGLSELTWDDIPSTVPAFTNAAFGLP